MTKDFAKSASKERNPRATRSSSEDHPSSIKPFIAGSVFGVLLCLGVQWLLSMNTNTGSVEPMVDSLTPEAVTGPVFDFYTKLREVEVIVPDESLVQESKDVLYLLQAGSFRDAKDAESMRVQLILLNLDVAISKFNHNGEIWHRVIVGPFPNRSIMSKTRTTLLENGIESLLLTQPVET